MYSVSGGDPRPSVTQQSEISPIQTLFTVTYTVKITKIIVIILTIIQNRNNLKPHCVSKQEKLVL
jgi:hypothetical protein